MKTNTILHRYLALFLGIVMLWSMLPMSVSAAKEMFLTNEVSAVSLLNITAPTARSKPDMTAECVRGDRYKVIDVFWTPSVSYGDKVITIEADEFFGFSTAYTVHVILEAIGDHYFKTTSERLSATKAFVNNAEATAKVAPYEYLYASGYDYEVQHTKLLEVTYTFPATASSLVVDHVDLTIDPPVAGEKVQTKDMYFSDEMIGKVRYEHQQGILKLGWYHNGTEMKPNDTFVYGEKYLAMVYLCTYMDGIKFAVDHTNLLFGLPNTAVTATVNGEAATVLPNNQAGTAHTHITVSKTFTCETKQSIAQIDISGIDLNPTNPDLPLNSKVVISPSQVSITEFHWDVLPSSNWRYGFADLMLAAKEGYAFTDDTVVTVNGYYVQKAYISRDGEEAVYRCAFAPVFLEDPKLHEHQFAYGNTPYEHWLECDCGESASFGGHEMDKDNRCEVCGFKIYDVSVLPFVDVNADDYFAQAVGWAYENEITKGTSDFTFSPDDTCTRAQVVTFLWRAAGCPEPTTTKNPFKDVKKTDWYYNAVLWAVEQNITVGTSKTEFSPDMECSTAIILTFLFRAVGAGDNGWYEEAAAWAESLDIVDITGLTVDPVTPCPRKAIVSFLYSIYG